MEFLPKEAKGRDGPVVPRAPETLYFIPVPFHRLLSLKVSVYTIFRSKRYRDAPFAGSDMRMKGDCKCRQEASTLEPSFLWRGMAALTSYTSQNSIQSRSMLIIASLSMVGMGKGEVNAYRECTVDLISLKSLSINHAIVTDRDDRKANTDRVMCCLHAAITLRLQALFTLRYTCCVASILSCHAPRLLDYPPQVFLVITSSIH